MSLEKVVANLVQRVERRFYGKYRGLVVDNADPEQLGRLKVRVPSVLGTNVVTGWAMPCVPYGGDANQGFLFIPEVGAGVWVEFEEGDLEFPIWVGTFWSKPGGESELPKPNNPDGTEQGSVQDPPTGKIIKTKKGHTIQLEDKDNEEMVTIVEAKNKHVVTLNEEGIKVTDGKNKHGFTMNEEGIKVTDGKNKHGFTLKAAGVTIETKTGAKVELTAAKVSVDGGAATVEVKGSLVEVKGTLIKLTESAALPVIRVTDQGIGNLGAPVVLTGPGNPMVLA